MPPPPASPGRPAASPRALAAALACLVGCTGGLEVPACPGVEMATLTLAGARVSASCAGGTPLDGTAACAAANPPVTADCQAAGPLPDCCFDRLFPPVLPFQAVVAFGALDASAAFCIQRPGATPYLGTRAPAAGGDALTASADTAGAVLSSCAATCAVTVHHEVTGLLARDPESGAVTGFTGQVVETASATPSAACAPCVPPCTATWTLARAP